MTEQVWANDTLDVLVTVLDELGAVRDITGATIVAVAADIRGSIISPTIAVTDAPAGKFTATFAADLFTVGKWTFQARVDLGGESQIVAEEEIRVLEAHV